MRKFKIFEAGPNGDLSSWGTDKNGKRWEDYDTIICPDGEVIDMQKLLDEQQKAKVALVRLLPWVAGFIGKLRFIYTFRIQTQATDGYNLLVNPQFTNKLNLLEKTFVLAHEIMHCLLNHLRRGKGHNPDRSNIAADYECNITLANIKPFTFDMIKNMDAYIDKKYDGKGYEEIYADVKDNSKDHQNNEKESKKAENNQNGGNGSNGSNGGQQYSADYKAGWNQAMEDYKAGKLKL